MMLTEFNIAFFALEYVRTCFSVVQTNRYVMIEDGTAHRALEWLTVEWLIADVGQHDVYLRI